MADRYPVMVDLTGRRCLVVGGGSVAVRKVRGLLDVGADVTVCAPDLAPALVALRDRGLVDHRAARYGSDSGDLGLAAENAAERWAFVVAATDDADVNARVVADATSSGTWANDATAGDGGPAALPATWRSGPVTLAVGTGGVHPGAAAWLRDLASAAIAPEHVVALELVQQVRAADVTPAAPPRPDWRSVVDSGMLDLIRAGQLAEAKERLQACLSSSSD